VNEIARVTVVGAGFMGHGIGQEFALGGYDVTLCDLAEAELGHAVQSIECNLEELVHWGIVPAELAATALDKIHTTTMLEEAAKEADLVVEAVFEDLELKRKVFQELDGICPQRTILASNTSTFVPSLLASATERSDRVLGMHYFYPPSLIPLVEVIPSESTSTKVVDIVCELLKSLGKSPIVVQKEAFGFIANRLQFALQREALYIVEQGIASPQDVDIAVRDGFGRRLAVAGPFEIAEPIGWDLELRIQENLFPHLASSAKPSPLVEDKVAKGELGVKTGRGFYEWTRESAIVWRRRMSETLVRLAAAEE
jgi:3-hydroxybutyryl-CoA dehydrogenase